ncbi:MAG: hypothetical protein U5K71_05320 [Gracilimonas sp.]|nr:hypothetical protein [Gracilimonas sp.]
MLKHARPGATFLLNAPYGADEVWDYIPEKVQQQIIEKDLKFYSIDAYKVARENGMGKSHQYRGCRPASLVCEICLSKRGSHTC